MKKSNLTINKPVASADTTLAKKVMASADMTLAERVMAPTPKFFRLIRTIGVVIGLVGASILASPVVLPVAVVTVGGYLVLAGSIATGVAQTAVGKE
jgi:hypothetical protein